MPGQFGFTIGTQPFTIPLKGTNAQIQLVLKRYAKSVAIPTEGRTAKEISDDILLGFMRQVRSGSKMIQMQEELEEKQLEVQAQIDADNDLFDEPEIPQEPLGG